MARAPQRVCFKKAVNAYLTEKSSLLASAETIREMDAPITEFDSGLWCGLVDCATVYGRDNIKVKFKDGTEI